MESSALSGEDITSRLNEMFEGEPAIEPLAEDTLMEKPVLPADTKVGPLLEIEAEAPAGTVTGATEEIVLRPREPARHPAEETVLSGDDVALRLEMIFDEGEEAGPAADEAVATQSAEATDLSTADGDKTQTAETFRAGEDTKPPLDIEEAGVAVDEVGFDAAAETLVVDGAESPLRPPLRRSRPRLPSPSTTRLRPRSRSLSRACPETTWLDAWRRYSPRSLIREEQPRRQHPQRKRRQCILTLSR